MLDMLNWSNRIDRYSSDLLNQVSGFVSTFKICYISNSLLVLVVFVKVNTIIICITYLNICSLHYVSSFECDSDTG